MNAIKCCNGCVAPKRYPGCSGHCSEYQEERKKYDELKAKYDFEKSISYGIRAQRTDRVQKALRKRR